MINGAHAVLYSDDALPPAELAVHPAEEAGPRHSAGLTGW